MAAYLKFVAISIIAAALLAAACADGGDEVAPLPSSTLPPPIPTQLPPTPTLPPPLELTSNIDTSAWPTFSSPLGFDIKYPPDWTIVESEISAFPLERVRIYNELTYGNYEERRGTLGRGYLPEDGAAWFDILANPLPYFDVGGLISICGTEEQREGGSSRAQETTVDGHRAVRCFQSGPSLAADIVSDSNILWIEEPPGRAIHVAYTVNGGDPDIIAAANAALATITFRE